MHVFTFQTGLPILMSNTTSCMLQIKFNIYRKLLYIFGLVFFLNTSLKRRVLLSLLSVTIQ